MVINQFRYGFLDLSWILSRNSYAIAARNETYTAQDIVRMTIQTISKFSKDLGLSVDKIFLVKDTWDSSLKGYIRTAMLREAGAPVEYKGDRRYMTAELLREIKSDPNSTKEDIEKAEKEYYFNETKNKAKWILVNDLGKLGLTTLSVPGFEFDDWGVIASHLLYDSDKPSVIISRDSDLIYSTSPKCFLWQPPLSSKPQKLITYDEAYNEYLPDRFKNRLGLYQYFALSNSTGVVGHNNMSRTLALGKDVDDAIEKAVFGGDFSDFDNPELFMKQYKSFDVWSFPRVEEVKRIITDCIGSIGHLGSIEEFHNFCMKNGIDGISDRYYSEFISHFDPKLFSE